MYAYYIPPVDVPCNSQYVGRKFNLPPTSTFPDLMRTNPACPSRLCKPCAGPMCKCNMNHANAPFLHRFFVYK